MLVFFLRIIVLVGIVIKVLRILEFFVFWYIIYLLKKLDFNLDLIFFLINLYKRGGGIYLLF